MESENPNAPDRFEILDANGNVAAAINDFELLDASGEPTIGASDLGYLFSPAQIGALLNALRKGHTVRWVPAVAPAPSKPKARHQTRPQTRTRQRRTTGSEPVRGMAIAA